MTVGFVGGESGPEFRLVFRDARSNSESAVAVESESNSSLWMGGGGGGDTRPDESLRGTSSGDCGGLRIFTFFFEACFLLGADHDDVSL